MTVSPMARHHRQADVCLRRPRQAAVALRADLQVQRRPRPGAGPPQHGLSPNKMALITSDCDAMRNHKHQMALITSEWCARPPASTTRSARSTVRLDHTAAQELSDHAQEPSFCQEFPPQFAWLHPKVSYVDLTAAMLTLRAVVLVAGSLLQADLDHRNLHLRQGRWPAEVTRQESSTVAAAVHTPYGAAAAVLSCSAAPDSTTAATFSSRPFFFRLERSAGGTPSSPRRVAAAARPHRRPSRAPTTATHRTAAARATTRRSRSPASRATSAPRPAPPAPRARPTTRPAPPPRARLSFC